MLRLLIYGYTTGVRSSRAIERKCADDVAFRFLAADQAPDFRSISGSAAATWTPSAACSPVAAPPGTALHERQPPRLPSSSYGVLGALPAR